MRKRQAKSPQNKYVSLIVVLRVESERDLYGMIFAIFDSTKGISDSFYMHMHIFMLDLLYLCIILLF
jgi:hypothetical protein